MEKRSDKPTVRPWTVVHACNLAREIADVVDAQIQVGMRPFLLTLNSSRPPTVPGLLEKIGKTAQPSLLQGWQDVRQWRKQFDANATNLNAQLIHSHSFAAGMAAVRGDDAVVYDLSRWIEEQPSGNGSWLARSFKTAEQFALARSSAVVVHQRALKSECIKRGIASEDVFVVPDPIPAIQVPAGKPNGYLDELHALKGTVSIGVRIASPGNSSTPSRNPTALTLPTILGAFAQLLQEVDSLKLVVVTPSELLLEVSKKAREIGIREKVILAPEEVCDQVINATDIVIADAIAMNAGSLEDVSLAPSAMSLGKAVLAADNSVNRELSAEGRGLLWYAADPEPSVQEIIQRLSFMARNADFRRALGEAGRQHLLQTRSPQQLGNLYDEVYRHAFAKANKGKPSQTASGSLVPMQAGI